MLRQAVDRALGRRRRAAAADVAGAPRRRSARPSVAFGGGEEPIAQRAAAPAASRSTSPAIRRSRCRCRPRRARLPVGLQLVASDTERLLEHRPCGGGRARRVDRLVVARPFFHAWERRIHAGSVGSCVPSTGASTGCRAPACRRSATGRPSTIAPSPPRWSPPASAADRGLGAISMRSIRRRAYELDADASCASRARCGRRIPRTTSSGRATSRPRTARSRAGVVRAAAVELGRRRPRRPGAGCWPGSA